MTPYRKDRQAARFRPAGWLASLSLFLGLTIPALPMAAGAAEPLVINPLEDFEGDRWELLRESVVGQSKVRLDGDLDVIAPVFGEDSAAVPVTIRLGRELGRVEEVVLLVDYNPFPVIARIRPHTRTDSVSFRIRMEQSSPVRVVARTSDGQWYAAGRLVQVAGGGCSVGGAPATASDMRPVGHVRVAAWARPDRARVRFQVMHPMDTGLASTEAGVPIPPFYVFNVDVRAAGRTLLEMETTPIARNPTFTVELDVPAEELANVQIVATDSRNTLYINEEVILFLEPSMSLPPQAALD